MTKGKTIALTRWTFVGNLLTSPLTCATSLSHPWETFNRLVGSAKHTWVQVWAVGEQIQIEVVCKNLNMKMLRDQRWLWPLSVSSLSFVGSVSSLAVHKTVWSLPTCPRSWSLWGKSWEAEGKCFERKAEKGLF